jgi:hypothetical protein
MDNAFRIPCVALTSVRFSGYPNTFSAARVYFPYTVWEWEPCTMNIVVDTTEYWISRGTLVHPRRSHTPDWQVPSSNTFLVVVHPSEPPVIPLPIAQSDRQSSPSATETPARVTAPTPSSDLICPSAYTKQSGYKEIPGDPRVQRSMVSAPRADPWGGDRPTQSQSRDLIHVVKRA